MAYGWDFLWLFYMTILNTLYFWLHKWWTDLMRLIAVVSPVCPDFSQTGLKLKTSLIQVRIIFYLLSKVCHTGKLIVLLKQHSSITGTIIWCAVFFSFLPLKYFWMRSLNKGVSYVLIADIWDLVLNSSMYEACVGCIILQKSRILNFESKAK